jgi:hypothetical protein
MNDANVAGRIPQHRLLADMWVPIQYELTAVYTQNASKIDVQLACEVSASAAPNANRKKSRPVDESESSCENDIVSCSDPSGTDEDMPTSVELKAKEQAMSGDVGARWLEVRKSIARADSKGGSIVSYVGESCRRS